MTAPVDPLSNGSRITVDDGRPSSFFMRQWQNLIALVVSVQATAAAALAAQTTADAALPKALASAHIFVGNASNIATDRAVSGDITVTNTGVVVIGAGKVTEAMQVLADNTTQNVSTSKHGYTPKLPNDATKYLDGTGAYTIPAGSGTYTDEQAQDAIGAMVADTATIDVTYTDATPELKWDVKSASITETMQVLADNTTQDVSITKHGYVPKAPNDATKFLRGDATWAVPSSGGGGSTDVNPFSDGGITKPTAAAFSIADDATVGHGTGAKVDLSTRGVEFTNTRGAASTTQSLFYKAAVSSTLVSVIAYIAPNFQETNSNKQYFYGVGIRDNAGKIDSFGLVFNSGVGNTEWQHATFTDISTAPTLSGLTGGHTACGRPIWLKLAKVSTNFVFSVSFNGETYTVVATVSATGFAGATLNDVGIIVYNGLAAGTEVVNLDCFSFAHS